MNNIRNALMQLGTGLPPGPPRAGPPAPVVAQIPAMPPLAAKPHVPAGKSSHFAKAHEAFQAGNHAAARSHAFRGIRALTPPPAPTA